MNLHISLTLCMEQYNQLLRLLQSQEQNTKDDSHIGYAMMAGNYCLLSCFETSWLIDSGATNHI